MSRVFHSSWASSLSRPSFRRNLRLPRHRSSSTCRPACRAWRCRCRRCRRATTRSRPSRARRRCAAMSSRPIPGSRCARRRCGSSRGRASREPDGDDRRRREVRVQGAAGRPLQRARRARGATSGCSTASSGRSNPASRSRSSTARPSRRWTSRCRAAASSPAASSTSSANRWPTRRSTAQRYQNIGGRRRLAPAGRPAMTNDIGEFRLFAIPPGQYYLSATLRNMGMMGDTDDRSGYAPTYFPGTANMAEAQKVTIGLGQVVSDINMALMPTRTARITGTAVDSQGRPMMGMVMAMPRGDSMMMMFGPPGQIKPDGSFVHQRPGAGHLRAADARRRAGRRVGVGRGHNQRRRRERRPAGRAASRRPRRAASSSTPRPRSRCSRRRCALIGAAGGVRHADDGRWRDRRP